MCDTIVVTSEFAADGVTLFGKNSDREPNEAHHLVSIPEMDHPAGSCLQLTYMQIPQVAHTYAVLLAKPFWMWGAEMGANEHGVVVGNEAVFTKIPYIKEIGMTGMDLLRLGLERGKTAYEALKVITQLLEQYGQGGNCGFHHKMYYHNSYILADPKEAWVLETADVHWAAIRVTGVYTISNAITIKNKWDLASPDLVMYAIDKGWCKSEQEFDFARCYSDFVYTRFGAGHERARNSHNSVKLDDTGVTPGTIMRALRTHDGDHRWHPGQGWKNSHVCAHTHFGPIRGSQTVGSMVSHLDPNHPTHFFTATSAPCTGIFKPMWVDVQGIETGPAPEGVYDPATLFWRHELLHRSTILDYQKRVKIYQEERDRLENQLIAKALDAAGNPIESRETLSKISFSEADAAETDWLNRIRKEEIVNRSGWLYSKTWAKINHQAQMPPIT